jgi:hypothetical protein
MTFAKKVDKNQASVVKALRDYGADVHLLHMVGGGIPDLLCLYEGQTLLLEIKDGIDKKLTPAQIKLFANWKGGHLYRVNSSEEAIEVLKSLKME